MLLILIKLLLILIKLMMILNLPNRITNFFWFSSRLDEHVPDITAPERVTVVQAQLMISSTRRIFLCRALSRPEIRRQTGQWSLCFEQMVAQQDSLADPASIQHCQILNITVSAHGFLREAKTTENGWKLPMTPSHFQASRRIFGAWWAMATSSPTSPQTMPKPRPVLESGIFKSLS